MNTQILEATEQLLLEAISGVTLARGATNEDQLFIDQTRAQLLGVIHGLRNVRGAIIRKAEIAHLEELVNGRKTS